ncbi:MAG: thioesterase, partial [Anaerolineaceae bacterium]|nr:thioesterase [Anaerolineaceae bacterium]
MPIEAGIVKELKITVEESDTARSSGGETLPPVLSTPRIVSYLERTAHQSILPFLSDGQTSV